MMKQDDLAQARGRELHLPGSPRAWVITDGKIGDEVQCFGIAKALGLQAERHLVRPRGLWAALSPWGPIDPQEAPHRAGSPIAAPWPDIAIAAGRRTVPYLRQVRRASGGRTFTVFMKDPYTGTKTADVLCLPMHDKLRGDNVVTSMTSPHGLTPEVFAQARAEPDPRLEFLPQPRLAMILGGVSGHYSFTSTDALRLAEIAVRHASGGYGLMVTPSRRTPPELLETIRQALESEGLLNSRAFVWDRHGINPYVSILAHAAAIIVTGDSVNMVGEATATGVPVHVYIPSGHGHRKMTQFIDRLVEVGAVRRYAGHVEQFSYESVDSTPHFAREVARRYLAFRAKL
ncbi:MAG: mitochondrial fission ELM1 family protein [Hyphomicrobiales bacterium]|nr:mitochondrial fission ELM1 family protein [Hyphomicrobiales bacterium]MDE2115460.1 mitochondrial fission ELM1 family protein [Hyphomicrobiales bacterium]